jgi:hypothetical protein
MGTIVSNLENSLEIINSLDKLPNIFKKDNSTILVDLKHTDMIQFRLEVIDNNTIQIKRQYTIDDALNIVMWLGCIALAIIFIFSLNTVFCSRVTAVGYIIGLITTLSIIGCYIESELLSPLRKLKSTIYKL